MWGTRSRTPRGASRAAAAFAAAVLLCAGVSLAGERVRFDDGDVEAPAPASKPSSPSRRSPSGAATGAGDAPREEAGAARSTTSFTSRRLVGRASQSGDESDASATPRVPAEAAPIEAAKPARPSPQPSRRDGIDERYPLSELREVPLEPAPAARRDERHVESESGAKLRGDLRYAPLASDTASGDGDAPEAAAAPAPDAEERARELPPAGERRASLAGLRFVPNPGPARAVPAAVVKPSFDDSRRGAAMPGTGSDGAPSREEQLLLDLVNVERSARNLRPVTWNAILAELARRHSADMLAMRKITHDSRGGDSLAQRLRRTSYKPREAAENVAFHADVVKAHRALMDSKGHRRNILDPALEEIGLGIARDAASDWIYVVQDFATPKRGAY